MSFIKSFPIKIALACILIFNFYSCSKDSDLLSEFVVSKNDNIQSISLLADDTFYIAPGQSSLLLDVLNNDTFTADSQITIVATSIPNNGEVTINENNTLTYVPQSEAPGAEETPSITNDVVEDDNFTYTVEVTKNDQTITEEVGEVSILVTDESKVIELKTLKAFPSAQGYGSDKVTGGKGGKIFYVTSLGNSDAGSFDNSTNTHSGTFNYALKHPDPGYIIFRVSGVFLISDDTNYYLSGSNVGNKTIMGASAPYPGVVMYGQRFVIDNASKGNFIIRGLTFLGGSNLTLKDDDCFTYRNQEGLILADNTFGYGADEAFSIGNSNNFVVQRNLAFEGAPGHNVGSIISADKSDLSPRGGSVHNNGYIHITHRFPNTSGLETAYIDVINQFAYNYGSRLNSHKFQVNLNDINNYYKSGSQSSSSPTNKWNSHIERDNPLWKPSPKIFTEGNFITGIWEDVNANNRPLWVQHISNNGFTAGDPLPSSFFANSMHPLGLDINIKSAKAAYQYNIVGKNIGARFYMNSNGERIKYIHPFVNDYFQDAIEGKDRAFKNNQSAFIKPDLPNSKEAYEDSDHDGMADNWERLHGLIVGVDDKESIKETWHIDSIKFINSAGFTNIQMFNDYIHGGFVILGDER